ncbi:MAG: hypothetical protein K2X26_10125 [Chitinophagaceae bacterium]|nr:hypothetical protein [Chitinophagaceae bacterium]
MYTKILNASIIRILFVLALSLFTITKSQAQLTKGNWLVGGNLSFSSTKYSNQVTASYSQIDFRLSSSVGYFFADRISFGLKPGYTYVKSDVGASSTSVSIFTIGPFFRYYFLKPEKTVNLLSEVNYAYTVSKNNNNPPSSSNLFSILAGPVIYFNQSVGLEFLLAYSRANYSKDVSENNNIFQFGIGLQVHLEKLK